jgi:hypothetical protein
MSLLVPCRHVAAETETLPTTLSGPSISAWSHRRANLDREWPSPPAWSDLADYSAAVGVVAESPPR